MSGSLVCCLLLPPLKSVYQIHPCRVNASVVQDGDFVLLEIDNPAHAKGDWVGLYLASADPTQTAPLKWTYCIPYLPSYETTGIANATFQVYLVREPIVFYLFSGGTYSPVLVAQSSPLSFVDNAAPVHPRVLPGLRSLSIKS